MKYLIEFKPLDRYFFGGEITFGEGQDSANYFAKSNFMPQSSTIIGTLRYEILRQKQLLNYESADSVKDYIGENSFSIDRALKEKPVTFGILSNISPLFIADKHTGYYTAMPLDYNIKLAIGNGKCYYSGKRTEQCIELNNYDPKTYDNYLHWINPDKQKLADVLKQRYPNEEQRILQEVYTVSEQIGIIKDKTKEEDKNAFFKQQLITLHPDLSFVCTVETTGPLMTGESVVYMGANRSIFKMSIQDTELDFSSPFPTNYFYNLHQYDRLLLLGDAYITDALKENALFIWGESNCFRNIESTIDKKISWSLPKKSDLFHLLPRGSVIYGEKIAQHLTIKNLQNAGMNIYL